MKRHPILLGLVLCVAAIAGMGQVRRVIRGSAWFEQNVAVAADAASARAALGITGTNGGSGGGSAIVGTVSNNVVSSGLLAADGTKTNVIAATAGMVTNTLGITTTPAELQNVAGTTSPLQAQINAKQATISVLPVANGGTAGSTAAAARTSLGAVSISGDTMTGPLLVTALTNNSLTVGRSAIVGAGKTESSSVVGVSYPLSIKPTMLPTSTFARMDASENDYRLLYAQNEYAIWQLILPRNFNGNLQLDLFYKMQSATSGSTIWSAEIWPAASGDTRDMNSQNFATANLSTNAVPGTAGFPSSFTMSCANVGALTAGSFVQIRLKRTDAVSGDAALLGLAIAYDAK